MRGKRQTSSYCRMSTSTRKEINELTMRATLRIWSCTVGWPPFAILVGDIIPRARRHEMPMPVDVGGEGSEDSGDRRSGDLFI
eukprot:scaffold16645_cov78-Skeletonema_marinoi.AAC.3